MYNPDGDGRKEWYLEECKKSIYEEGTSELIERIFNSTELEEKAFDKDVCDFTDAEVVDLFKSFNSRSRARLSNTAWYLSRYHQWCYDKGLTQKIDDAFDDRTIERIIKEVIPNEMLLDSYFTKKDLTEVVELDPDPINRFIIFGLYYGIRGDDLVDLLNVKIEDLNKEEKTVSLISGRKAFVDDYFIDLMIKANNTEEFKQNRVGNHRNIKQKIYVKNGYIIRPCASNGELYDYKPVKAKFITNRIQRFKNEFDADFISIANLNKNGLINYIREKYEAKGISLKTALMYNNGNYVYDKETQDYIDEFGSKKTTRLLRRELKDIIDKL
jgi:hypothetical protein